MYLQTITRSGVPNVNGIVYSKESFNKMREYQKDIVFSLCKCKENYTSELSIVKLEDEIGKITGIYDGSISVDIYDQYKEYIYDALTSGYLPAMRYIANVSEPNKDDISEVTNMYLICYDLIKIPNITINPEEKNSYIKPIKRAKEIGADIILMNDPDGDRVGVAALHNNEYVLLSGNESANLLLDYILMKRKENGTLKENSIVFNTVVTSHLGKKICDSYGVKLESFLTGFKYIGERIHYYETNDSTYDFVFGYEESDGCLISKEVRDKDGTQAILLYTELANYYKNMGLDLVEAYKNIEKKYGFYKSKLFNIYLRGENGKDEIIRILNEIRNDPILKIGDRTVTKIIDYKKQKIYERNNNIIKDYKELPISDVIKFVFSDDSNIEIRPSGTEPKCKFYIELSSTNYILEEEIDNIFNFLRKKYKF